MSLSLIDRDGTVKRRCIWCNHLRSDVYCTNPTQRKVNRTYLCEACHTEIVRDALDHYREQVEAGVPAGQRMVLCPMSGAASQRFFDEVRAAIEEIIAPRAIEGTA